MQAGKQLAGEVSNGRSWRAKRNGLFVFICVVWGLGFGGSIDRLLYIDGRRSNGEWKKSKGVAEVRWKGLGMLFSWIDVLKKSR